MAGVVPVITLTDCVSPLMSRVSDTVAQPASYLLLLTLTPVTHTDQRLIQIIHIHSVELNDGGSLIY